MEFFLYAEGLTTVTPIDLATHETLELTEILKSPPSLSQLILPIDEHFSALQRLTHIFYKCILNKNRVENNI